MEVADVEGGKEKLDCNVEPMTESDEMRKMPGRRLDRVAHSRTRSSPHCTDPGPESIEF